jgi:hypothetical protein
VERSGKYRICKMPLPFWWVDDEFTVRRVGFAIATAATAYSKRIPVQMPLECPTSITDRLIYCCRIWVGLPETNLQRISKTTTPGDESGFDVRLSPQRRCGRNTLGLPSQAISISHSHRKGKTRISRESLSGNLAFPHQAQHEQAPSCQN